MLYVYGIADVLHFETIAEAGHDAADVTPLPCGAFCAAISVMSQCTIEATPQSVWRHESVLARLMQNHTVLPMRFGTVCRDAEALSACLLRSAGRLANDLARLNGKVEMALRIAEDDGNTVSPGECAGSDSVPIMANDGELSHRGAAYLRARLRRYHSDTVRHDRGKRLGELLRQHLHAVADDFVCAAPADASAGFRVSCLVERSRVAAFADALVRFGEDHRRFDVTCTGPWAPYSFVAPPAISAEAS